MKRGKKRMGIIFGMVLIVIIGVVLIFFRLPYSKTKKEFKNLKNDITKTAKTTSHENEHFTEEDIANLPIPVQRYFRHCGYIGTPKMSYMKAYYKDVDFSLGRDKPNINMDYTQYNIVEEPVRIAYIDSSMFGIPFEGLDTYVNGNGSMKGIIAKLVTLFHEKGPSLDKASLVTSLSECLIAPNIALQDYITWEAMDDLHAKATISYYGIHASGIFTFNEQGEMLAFTTEDREAVSMDGKVEKVKWTAACNEYKEINGIRQPVSFQAIWHYDEGDLIYFDGKNIEIEFY